MMMRYILLLLVVLLGTVPGRAQELGTCELGRAKGVLDVSDVRATVFNTGSLFFGHQVDDGSGYEVPLSQYRDRLRPPSAIFAAGLWVGGKVDGEIRVAGSRYSQFEFWPGPLQDGAVLPNPADCSAYDRIFVVSRQDVARYLQTGEATADLRDWPYDLGAPVLDGDGVAGNYDLEAGDQPAIYGAQSAWWVMNDVGNVHEQTDGDPLGIEVQVTAFAAPDGARAIRQSTLYRYRIINQNTQAIDSAYVSFFTAPSLGDAYDNYIGSDTTRGYGFVYNVNAMDAEYGIPPAQGYQVLEGPVGLPNGRDDDGDGMTDEPGELLGMTASTHFLNSGPGATIDPSTASHYYNHMQGRWNDGTPVTEGGYGFQTGSAVTTFAYPGDPLAGAFWSEVCPDPDCADPNHGGRRRLVVHTGPFRLEPGEATEVVFGLPFAQGANRLDSVIQLRTAAEIVRNAWASSFFEPSRVEGVTALPEVPGAVELTAPTPNPFRDRLTVRYTLPDAMPARVTVLDVLGREVAVLTQGEQPAGPRTVEVDTARWPSGVYLVRVEVGTEQRTFPVVKAQ